MKYLNGTMISGYGQGGGTATIGAHQISAAKFHGWLTDGPLKGRGVMVIGPSYQLFAVNPDDPNDRIRLTPVGGPDPMPAPIMAYANGSRWAANLYNAPTFYSDQGPIPGEPLAVGPDGTIAHRGPGFAGLYLDGVLITNGYVSAEHLCVVGAGQVVWCESGALKTVGLPMPALVPAASYALPRVIVIDGAPWLLYAAYRASGPQLLLHPFGETRGYLLAEGPTVFDPIGRYGTYSPDVSVLSPTQVVVGYSRFAGEQPGHLVPHEIDLASPRIDLSIEPPLPPVTIGTFDHPHWQAAFKGSSNHGAYTTPFNADILELPFHEMAVPKHVFANLRQNFHPFAEVASTVPDEYLRGIMVSTEGGEPVDEVEWAEASAVAVRLKVPLVWCLDAVLWRDSDAKIQARPRVAGLEIIPMLECYPFRMDANGQRVGSGGAIQSVQAIVASWRADLEFLRPRFARLAVVISSYTQSGNFPIALIAELHPHAADLVRAFKPMLVSFFSWGRGSGILSNAQTLLPIVEQWVNGQPEGEPDVLVLTPRPDPPPPGPTPPFPPTPIPPTPPVPPIEETDMKPQPDTYWQPIWDKFAPSFAQQYNISEADAKQGMREAVDAFQRTKANGGPEVAPTIPEMLAFCLSRKFGMSAADREALALIAVSLRR